MRAGFAFAGWLAAGTVVVVAAAAVLALAVWASLSPAEREVGWALLAPRVPLVLLWLFFLPFVLGALLRWWWDAYPMAARRLAESLRVMHTVNPGHRLPVAGGAEIRRLAEAANQFAAAHEALQRDVRARVRASSARLEHEKNRFAALMSELAHAVVVCNRDGRILLYNTRAAATFGGDTALGLGRSLFGVLDRQPVVHALDKLQHRVAQRAADPVAHFVTARDGRLLRAQMAPVLEGDRVDGFVLLIEDITRSVEATSRRDATLQALVEGTRAAVANIRAAAETLDDHDEMAPAQRRRFIGVIRDEATRLSARLTHTLADLGTATQARWPLEDMLAGDLVEALQRNFEVGPGVVAEFSGRHEALWLAVDSYALVQALTFVAARLRAECGTRTLALALDAEGRFARLSLGWTGRALAPEQLHAWETEPMAMAGEAHDVSLKAVIERHGGELWCASEPGDGAHRLTVQLPLAPSEPSEPNAPGGEGGLPGRPVYYDFDLFRETGQSAELDERTLASLSFTVFDTETTGLSPSKGDEIVSIGAVRIVNGRLLEHERFEQLVDPQRPIRAESVRVHGITAQMVAGQPTIDQVLPAFHRFAHDTVLVAHNAAFDLRFLQLKEAAAGVRFDHPVLDTLLLSALVHPGQPEAEHRLERIAERLGVRVMGRHTALGDAIVTGEVLLRLIPLLAERGIVTLGQARAASQRTAYAKLEY